MKPLLLALTLSLSFSALAADGKSVSYKSGDDTVPGMLYTPAGKGPFPALIVIHEWWGLNDYIKSRTEQLAKMGYVAFAADMYGNGQTTAQAAKAGPIARTGAMI